MQKITQLDLVSIESELKKRWKFPYKWGRKQSDYCDYLTDFVYEIRTFEELIVTLEVKFPAQSHYQYYALNRWYNFWSAQAVEHIFCSVAGIVPAKNRRDRLVDFSIQGISFDHKTTVFPRTFPHNIAFAKANPDELIKWLYLNQSQGQRRHLKNRLFIVLHRRFGDHWKLKAELAYLQHLVENYVDNFDASRLRGFTFVDNQVTWADLIFGTVGGQSADNL